jgi:hypothetical protein
MKKYFLIVAGLLAAIVFSIDVVPVRAEDNDLDQQCNVTGSLKSTNGRDLEKLSGVNVVVSKKPANVVVVGQDEEEEGVSIEVIVTSLYGAIAHKDAVIKTMCQGYPYRNSAKAECTDEDKRIYGTSGTGKYYYLETSKYCSPEHLSNSQAYPSPDPYVYRPVKDIKVWLEPSKQTSDWLGWSSVGGDRASVRYIYPERWSVGNWLPDDQYTTRRALDSRWDIPYYMEWLKSMGEFNFLAGDVRLSTPLWSVTMEEVISPFGDQTKGLGIFGAMNSANAVSYVGSSPMGEQIDLDCEFLKYGRGAVLGYPTAVKGWKDYSDEYFGYDFLKKARANCIPNRVVDTVYPDTETNPDGAVYGYSFNNIPLDLPGQWYIRVRIKLGLATFTNYDSLGERTLTEKKPDGWYTDGVLDAVVQDYPSSWDNSNTEIDFDPTAEDSGFFYSYIILTTPCNPNEEGNCFDGTD